MWTRLASSILGSLALLSVPLASHADVTNATDPSALKPLGNSHYIVTRIDLRKCAYPACGGVFVKAVNQALTRCADGTFQKECHVPVVDTNGRGWTNENHDAFDKAFPQGLALVLGNLRAVPDPVSLQNVDTLIVQQGWLGQAQSKPAGTFYGLKSSGIVCITSPCPTITETTLNFPASRNIAGVDLAVSGATPKQVDAGNQALADGTGILGAGFHTVVRGPAGKGQQFVAREFYLLIPDMIR
jgi:hypothetical protein